MPEMTSSRMQRADAVRLERLRLRLSQDDVAGACEPEFSQPTISKAELGRGSDEVYEAIEAALRKLAESRST